MSAAFFTWLHPGLLSKGFASFTCGIGMYQLVGGVLGGVLGGVQHDFVTPYGFTPDTWGWVVKGGASAAGIFTMLLPLLSYFGAN